MTTFNNGESGSSVRTKINAAITSVDSLDTVLTVDSGHLGINEATPTANLHVGGDMILDVAHPSSTSSLGIGTDALEDSSAASATAIGVSALKENTTGVGNTAVGQNALRDNTTSAHSTAVGVNALAVNNGAQNQAFGAYALSSLDDGDHNVGIGYNAGASLTTGSNNTIIGHDAAASAADVSNEITLGDTSVDKFRVPGINFTIKDSTATEDYVLTVDANGEAGWEAAGSTSATTWVNFNSISTLSITDSNNVSSVTDNAVGNFTVNFTSTLSSAGYALAGYGVAYATTNVSGSTQFGLVPTATNSQLPLLKSTSAVRILMGNGSNGVPADSGNYSLTVMG